jgi:LPXTG-motif cell wall-anchored protein
VAVKNSVSETWPGDIEGDVTLSEGETGYDALIQILDANSYSYDISSESWGHSINAIAGISNNTTDWSEYWSLYYNGSYANYGVDGYVYGGETATLQDGDKLSVEFYSANAGGGDDDDDDDDDVIDREVVPVDTMYNDVMNITDKALSGDAVAYGSEWKVLALARAGKLSNDKASVYYASVEAALKAAGGSKLDSTYATTNARVAIALAAIGKNPTDVNGYNLLEPLADMNYITKQGVNAAVYTLIALDTKNYEVPTASAGAVQTTRDGLITYILNQELTGGGWSYSGTEADPDLTAMVLEALAPYYSASVSGAEKASASEIQAAVERGIQVLSDMQNKDGSYSSWGSANSNSIAQVITALTSLGINPATDSRFIKNNYSMLDALSDYYVAGQGFLYTTESAAPDDYSLNQIAYALAAYKRLAQGQTSLYNMTDTTENIEATEAPASTETEVTTEAATATSETAGTSPQTGDQTPLAEISGLLILAFAGILVTSRKKKA